MKQGQASYKTRDPMQMGAMTKVSPTGVAMIGNAQGNHADGHDLSTGPVPVFMGQGPQAPMDTCTSHACGSQGKR